MRRLELEVEEKLESLVIVTVPRPRRWTKAGKHRNIADFPPNHLTRWNSYSLMRAPSLAGYGQLEVSYSEPLPIEMASVSIRGLGQSWTGKMPDRLIESRIGGRLRHLQREVIVRRLKCVPGFFCSSIFRIVGWSGYLHPSRCHAAINLPC